MNTGNETNESSPENARAGPSNEATQRQLRHGRSFATQEELEAAEISLFKSVLDKIDWRQFTSRDKDHLKNMETVWHMMQGRPTAPLFPFGSYEGVNYRLITHNCHKTAPRAPDDHDAEKTRKGHPRKADDECFYLEYKIQEGGRQRTKGFTSIYLGSLRWRKETEPTSAPWKFWQTDVLVQINFDGHAGPVWIMQYEFGKTEEDFQQLRGPVVPLLAKIADSIDEIDGYKPWKLRTAAHVSEVFEYPLYQWVEDGPFTHPKDISKDVSEFTYRRNATARAIRSVVHYLRECGKIGESAEQLAKRAEDDELVQNALWGLLKDEEKKPYMSL